MPALNPAEVTPAFLKKESARAISWIYFKANQDIMFAAIGIQTGFRPCKSGRSVGESLPSLFGEVLNTQEISARRNPDHPHGNPFTDRRPTQIIHNAPQSKRCFS